MNDFRRSFAGGYACLSAWADLLDRINVFPVADGDTGTNLRISLAPLRNHEADSKTTRNLLARCATGNSGNIAATFFREFYQTERFSDLAETATRGREKAWQAVADPCDGTMLTIFDSLAETLASHPDQETLYPPLSHALQQAVHTTSQLLPDCKKAGVVDSGALAMYIFLDGFFRQVTRQNDRPVPILKLFAGKLVINSSFRPETTNCYCVDVILQPDSRQPLIQNDIAKLGKSVVVVEDESSLKVHIHTPDPDQLRGELGSLGKILQWSDEEIEQTIAEQHPGSIKKQALHIMTDAAGSIPGKIARHHGITLLDSYIITGGNARPESLYTPDQLYPLMRKGWKITTAQASNFERHQHYQSACQQFGPTLYLCVGSAFTGNYSAAMAWKKEHDPDNLLTVIDTGAASGRLGLIALLTARHAENVDTPEEVLNYAQQIITECEEFVFIDELKYLVAGGRISRAGGFFGDFLHMKPVVSPTWEGVRKVGVVHSSKGQLTFALKKLAERFDWNSTPVIMLNFSDNEEWIAETVHQQLRALLPEAEILITPLSLTSGVHMGPGTWSISIAPDHSIPIMR